MRVDPAGPKMLSNVHLLLLSGRSKDLVPLPHTTGVVHSAGCSHDSDLVSDLKSVVLLGQDNVGLLVTIGSDEGVDSLHGDVVEVLASLADGGLGGSLVNDEHERVVVFNSLDGALSAQGVLHDGVLVPG